MSRFLIALAGPVLIAAAALLWAPGTAIAQQPAAPAAAQPEDAKAVQPGDHVLGNPDAPVTIIEYASLTCPHCAHFHEDTLPKLKAEYIDTGKVKLVFRDFPLDKVALQASTLAECVPAERYFGFLGVLFQSQANWATASDPTAALVRLGKVGGLSAEQIDACFKDERLTDAIVAERLAGEKAFDIRSTPSFIIGGKKYSGALTFEQVQDLLKPLLP